MVSGCLRTTLGPTCRSLPTALHSARITMRRIIVSKVLSPVLNRANRAANSSRDCESFRWQAKSDSQAGSCRNSFRPKVAARRQSPLFSVEIISFSSVPLTTFLQPPALALPRNPAPPPPSVARRRAPAVRPLSSETSVTTKSFLPPLPPLETLPAHIAASNKPSADAVESDNGCPCQYRPPQVAVAPHPGPPPVPRTSDTPPATKMAHRGASPRPCVRSVTRCTFLRSPASACSIATGAAASSSEIPPGSSPAARCSLQHRDSTFSLARDHGACAPA